MSGVTPLRPSELQRRILQMLAEGLTDRAIALQLSIGERTVREHLRALAEASGSKGRFALGAAAVRLGWIE